MCHPPTNQPTNPQCPARATFPRAVACSPSALTVISFSRLWSSPAHADDENALPLCPLTFGRLAAPRTAIVSVPRELDSLAREVHGRERGRSNQPVCPSDVARKPPHSIRFEQRRHVLAYHHSRYRHGCYSCPPPPCHALPSPPPPRPCRCRDCTLPLQPRPGRRGSSQGAASAAASRLVEQGRRRRRRRRWWEGRCAGP